MTVKFELNGRPSAVDCPPGENLRDLLRRLGALSVKNGCDGEGACGLCAVLLDGRLVNSCLVLAAQAGGRRIETVERWSDRRELGPIQQALVDCGCVQCGYCTPAVALAIHELLAREPDPDEAAIRDALSGTLCRCTGYAQFFAAVRLAARRLADPTAPAEPGPEYRPDLRHVGKDRGKVDAWTLARGGKAFVEDRVEPGACHLALLGSPHAHARIRSIDCAAALALPGVVAVVTHENCPDQIYTTAGQGFPEPSPHDQRMFSRHLRHEGDRVAAVLAESPELARAALALITVDYEILPPVLSLAAARSPGAPVIHAGEVRYLAGSPPAGTTTAGDGQDDPVVYQFPIGADPHRNLAASVSGGIGSLEAGFAAAEATVCQTYRANRVQCTPLEPHVVYARIEAGRLVLHASTQVPWHLRRIVARVIGIPENKIRVVKEHLGGGFGAKQDVVVEDIAGWLAWTTGRSVFFRYDRRQEFIASRTRHAMDITVRLGAQRDGTLTAIHMDVQADTGPYGQHCLTVPMNGVSKSLPLLVCPNAGFAVQSWYTNRSPAGAYQGYGAPQASFALQTALAELAAKLGVDQLDLLEKNRVRSGTRIEILKSLGEGRPGAALTLGACGLGEMIARGREAIGWDRPKPPPSGPDWRLGRGAVIIQQGSGLPGLDAANATVRLLADGTVILLSGGADLGTGLDTVTAKLVAEALCLEMDDVAVVSGDTDHTPFDKGAYASSGTYFSGNAALLAAQELRAKILEAAAPLLGAATADLRLEPRGRVVAPGGRETSLAELGHQAIQGAGHHELEGHGHFKTEHAAFPYGVQFVELEANRRDGTVRVRRFHAWQDCGTPINPALARGQIYGGVLKAIGHALYEEMLYDAEGRCINPNFTDYKIPSILEMPDDFRVELWPVPDEEGPFGAKSVAEIAVNGAAPAIAIAIHDALGIWMREWPFTPERVLEALDGLKKG
jgi:putative selenate reductase molybdopterin-binding subunit